MTEYKRVVYYDSDFIFTHSPATCVEHCPDAAPLCAVTDTGAWLSKDRGFKYFNAGFLALTPSTEEFRWLFANYKDAAQRQFAEQDLLNDRFRGKWHELKKACNHQMARRDDYLQETGIAYHAKTREIKSIAWLPAGLRDIVFLTPPPPPSKQPLHPNADAHAHADAALQYGSYEKHSGVGCGGISKDCRVRLTIGEGGTYKSSTGSTIAQCSTTCDEAGSDCGGFEYDSTTTRCSFRSSTLCNRVPKDTKACYTKAVPDQSAPHISDPEELSTWVAKWP